MLDRLTNLIAVFAMSASILAGAVCIRNAWMHTAPWDQEWAPRQATTPSHSAEEIVRAMQNASSEGELADATKLETYLRSDFRPTGKVLRRFTSEELADVCIAFLQPLLLLAIPMSMNYLRHGKLRVWNRGT